MIMLGELVRLEVQVEEMSLLSRLGEMGRPRPAEMARTEEMATPAEMGRPAEMSMELSTLGEMRRSSRARVNASIRYFCGCGGIKASIMKEAQIAGKLSPIDSHTHGDAQLMMLAKHTVNRRLVHITGSSGSAQRTFVNNALGSSQVHHLTRGVKFLASDCPTQPSVFVAF